MHAIGIHGGAGTLSLDDLSVSATRPYREGLERALTAGLDLLERGEPALEAVVAAVQVLEQDPLFNAGRGAVLAADGSVELDASIMDGRDLRAGAVAAIRHVRSPIDLARRVMEHSGHVMLVGVGAE